MGLFQLAGLFFQVYCLYKISFWFGERVGGGGGGGYCTVAVFILTKFERASNQFSFQFQTVFLLYCQSYTPGEHNKEADTFKCYYLIDGVVMQFLFDV